MKAIHLPSTATGAEVAAALREHGYAIVDNLASNELMDRIKAEMDPYIGRTDYGHDDFVGLATKRTGSLVARSASARELIMNETVLGAAADFLSHASAFQLHLTQIISIFPSSKAQSIHQDQLAWDFFPFPKSYDVQCNVLWAMTDYTEEMGATRLVPGSHTEDPDREYSIEDTIPAVMTRGSALFYTGKIFHGAGANVSDRVRQAINITYSVGWVRQEENQFLSTPLEVARTLPDDLLKLMGYQMGCFALGYVGDIQDPMSVIRDISQDAPLDVTLAEKAAEKSGAAANLLRSGAI